jgi:hypothetical protein
MVAAIVAPFGLFAANVTVVALIRGLTGFGGAMPLSQATFLLATALLWLGLSFYLLTQLPAANAAHDPSCKTRNGVLGTLWGLSLGGGFFVLMKMPRSWEDLQPWHWLLLAGGLVTTVLGWRRAEELVMNRVVPARPSEHVEPGLGRGKNDARNVRGQGWEFLVRVMVSNTLKATLMVLVFFMVFQIFLRKEQQDGWLAAAARVTQDPSTFYILVPLAMITGLQWLSGVRHFRSLPVRSSVLTSVICIFFALPTVTMLAATGLLQALLPDGRVTGDWLSSMCLMSGLVLLAPGLLLHFGLNWKSYFLVVMPVFCAGPLSGLLLPFIPGPWRVVISIIAWGAGAALVHRAITRGSQTYRHSLSWPAKSF